jgi:Kef-type K+ transport system membrane component KefB
MGQEAFYEIVLLLSVIGVGYVITHVAVERLSRRFLFAGGIEYVVLGVTLGPLLGLIDQDLARNLRPVLLLGTGALGMLAGLELAPGRERTSARGAWPAAFAITVFTALTMIGAPLSAAVGLGYDVQGEHAWTAALLLAGIVALGADGAVVRSVALSIGARGPAIEMGAAVATRVRALATVGFGVLYAVVDGGEVLAMRPLWPMFEALALQVGAGVTLGLLFSALVYRKLDERTLLTVVVGMVFLAGGFAFAMGVSAIFVNFVAGLTFVRTSSHASEALRTMYSIKQPFVIALYFFAGLEWVSGEIWVYSLIIPFVLLRQLGRRLGGLVGGKLGGWSSDLTPATSAPGGLSIGFMLSTGLLFRNVPGVADAYGPLVTALVLLELASLRTVRRWLLDVSDVAPKAPTKLA